MGSHDCEGRELPSAPTLASELVRDFSIPGSGVGLSRAYESAKRDKRDKSGRNLASYLRARFTQCVPAEWYRFVSNNRWSGIWTLNIDDVAERAYEAWSDSNGQRPVSVSWCDPYQPQNSIANEVLIVHLHGKLSADASRAHLRNEDLRLVFDINEYRGATVRPQSWHYIFGDEFQQRPFMVVGARLSDEFDLAESIRRRNRSMSFSGIPSLVILKEFDELQLEEFEEWGLIPISSPAASFFARLNEDLQPYRTEIALAVPGFAPEPSSMQYRFLQQFEKLSLDRDKYNDPIHAFYDGYDPVWADILADRDAELDIVQRLGNQVVRSAADQIAHCIWGNPFTGKSTALLRVARRLIAANFDVYRFRAETRLDVEAAHWWLSKTDRVVLIFDGFADFASDIGRLCELGESSGTIVTVVASEREKRRPRIYDGIASKYLNHSDTLLIDNLSKREIENLIRTLGNAGRLGRITNLRKSEQYRYFTDENKKQLFSALTNLERGRGFIARLSDQYEAIGDPDLRAAYAICCMTYAIGHPLPITILCDSFNLPLDSLLHELSAEGRLFDVLEVSGTGNVKPRHRAIASTVVERLVTRAESYTLSLLLAKNLSAYISKEAISLRTIPHRIIRELMDHQFIAEWIGEAHVARWFDELAVEYSWNSRYWEQRALAEANANRFDRAESYAEQAVSRRADSFTFNTLGTVLMRRAAEGFRPLSDESTDYYWRGVRSLQDALSASRRPTAYPYITFFKYTESLVKRTQLNSQVVESVADEWGRWWNRAQHDPVFEHPELRSQLNAYLENWMELLKSRASGSKSAKPHPTAT